MNLLEIILLIALVIIALNVVVRLSGKIEYNNLETLNIAKHQKAILWLIVANLLTLLIPFARQSQIDIIGIVISIIGCVFVYRLAKALKVSLAWVYEVFFFIPLIGLIALLVLNGRATRALQTHGVRVGVMGANKDDLSKLTANDN